MDVTKFLNELVIAANIVIVIALLPEMLGRVPTQAKTGLEWGTVAFVTTEGALFKPRFRFLQLPRAMPVGRSFVQSGKRLPR